MIDYVIVFICVETVSLQHTQFVMIVLTKSPSHIRRLTVTS
jgi:hypothetical protein